MDRYGVERCERTDVVEQVWLNKRAWKCERRKSLAHEVAEEAREAYVDGVVNRMLVG